ncbi:ArsR/SmtB family transcription factor [Peribacillus frigoritolerans]|uniref:ArsR/SmtB family transcription factor n=2 Tax=Peribacillus frigoritolerans TaxID=450367 RepID=UPI0024C1425D|nr:metalloregulator ArsR/SmtB family transcription factor [Peribacillus frigoritolerans]WHX60876.1 metalloregulator ArsR/SmtB family transcription factor [Peribacillus frigoritolerans]
MRDCNIKSQQIIPVKLVKIERRIYLHKNSFLDVDIFFFYSYNSFMTLKQTSDNQRIKIFNALADEKRINIIRILSQQDTRPRCSDIGRRLEISKSNGSYHLKILAEANLVHIDKEGVTKYVSLNKETFKQYLPGFLATL